MIAIPVGEYEFLKQRRDQLQKHHCEQIQDAYNDMQMKMTDAIVKQGMSAGTPAGGNGLKGLARRIGEKVYAWVNRNMPVVIGVAGFGIVCAVVGHYGQMGFHLGWFLGFELPLYLFLLWAVYRVWRMYHKYKKQKED